jgi:hypothetical protein
MKNIDRSTLFSSRKSIWLGMFASIVTIIGMSVILENFVLIVGRVWGDFLGTSEVWTEHMYGLETNAWVLLLAIRSISFSLAGFIGARVAPTSRHTLFALFIAALIATSFEQLPLALAHSIWSLALWSLSAPACTCLGVVAAWKSEKKP